jgi:uncharacterized cupin superfamily protein
MPEIHVHRIELPAPPPGAGGWQPHQQFSATTAAVGSMSCHYSVLAPGHSPHPPHAHVEEELLIILEGSADIVIAKTPDDASPTVTPMTTGQFSYYAAWQYHTLKNVSDRPVTYLMLKWTGPKPPRALRRLIDAFRAKGPLLPSGVFDARAAMAADVPRAFATVDLLGGRTGSLARLHCHLSKVKPGGGYAAHADPYDVAIVLLGGEIDLGAGHLLKDCGVAYFGAEQTHGMHNPGAESATYLVFEFHKRRR